MSGIPSRPPPTPNGAAVVPNVGSFAPNGPTIGDPMSNPDAPPGPTGAHDPAFGSPAWAHVIGMMWLIAVPSPGNVNNVFAILPVGASVKNCVVSDHVLFVFTALLRNVS